MNRQLCEQLTTGYEGRVNHLYLDSRGLVTVAVGQMLPNAQIASALFGYDVTEHFERVKAMAPGHAASFYFYEGAPILPDSIIEQTFAHSLDSAIASARKLLPNFDALPDKVSAVVVDMEFNIGAGGLAKFHNTLSALARGDYNAAADGLAQSLWAKQVGNRAIQNIALLRSAA